MDKNFGILKVSVQSGNGAYPIKDAAVIVYYGGKIIKVMDTDRNGNTAAVDISAPPAVLSEEPQSKYSPYGVCDVSVNKEGYYTNIYKNVQIFDAETSNLEVQLIPLPEYVRGEDTFKVFDISQHNLAVTGGYNG